ncbi:MAG: hypothetical protein A3K10_11550 [Bacteroidetes bacterium RIFCSPLOWO2_12_FULL_31_6]|nr:MAG: hypothetical protein A3K10_11550 [Bacteroidetes bacterium RIFCSPLOWO2_12_FULL_31_6]
MTLPPYLKSGDTIAIVAPARKIVIEEIKPAIDLFKSWGLKVVLGKNLFCAYNQFAGTEKERAADLQLALDDKNIKAVFCARGGYGCVRIIDMLDFSSFLKFPKWIIGFSDITVFHSHIHNLGIGSLHAAMPYNLSKLLHSFNFDVQSQEKRKITNYELRITNSAVYNFQVITLKKSLFGDPLSYSIKPHPLNKKGKADGILIGGNLSILYSLAGSVSDIDTAGKILFIEDLDEYLYHIDRMMMNLKRSGKLSNLAGLIVGGMSDMKDNKVAFSKTAEQIISEAVAEYKYPVCYNFSAGHIENNCALTFGKTIEFEVGNNVVIKFSNEPIK